MCEKPNVNNAGSLHAKDLMDGELSSMTDSATEREKTRPSQVKPQASKERSGQVSPLANKLESAVLASKTGMTRSGHMELFSSDGDPYVAASRTSNWLPNLTSPKADTAKSEQE